jgi:hypothetical protein
MRIPNFVHFTDSKESIGLFPIDKREFSAPIKGTLLVIFPTDKKEVFPTDKKTFPKLQRGSTKRNYQKA